MTDNAIIFTEESLKKHDAELLDKVAEKLKTDIEKYWYRSELDMSADNVNCLIDDVINEMKAEMQKGKENKNNICDYDKDCPTCWSRAFCKEYNGADAERGRE